MLEELAKELFPEAFRELPPNAFKLTKWLRRIRKRNALRYTAKIIRKWEDRDAAG